MDTVIGQISYTDIAFYLFKMGSWWILGVPAYEEFLWIPYI